MILFYLDFYFKRFWFYIIRVILFTFFAFNLIKHTPNQFQSNNYETIVLLLYLIIFFITITLINRIYGFSKYWLNEAFNLSKKN